MNRLADQADARIYCVCYFGGDPTPQMPHALATSRILADRGVRICWETNGTMQPKLLPPVTFQSDPNPRWWWPAPCWCPATLTLKRSAKSWLWRKGTLRRTR